MPLPQRPAAVVFDMDGVIFDTEVIYRDALTEATAEFGREMPISLFKSMIGRPGDTNRAAMIEHFGPDLPVDDLLRRAKVLFQERVAAGPPLKAGIIELLDHLDAAGLPRAIATSSKRATVDHHLEAHGLTERFPVVVAHGDYVLGKPNPDPFLAAAERLGLPPEACLALEDSHNGVRAASTAGMMTVMVPDLLTATDEMRLLCVRIARDLHEVQGWLSAA
jgi:HAD superfamily hydrolase (TIGR01509 family)